MLPKTFFHLSRFLACCRIDDLLKPKAVRLAILILGMLTSRVAAVDPLVASAAPDGAAGLAVKPATPLDIRTPTESRFPHINAPAVFGVRPTHPFLFAVPATGIRPMRFAAANLPAGLILNEATGLITGTVDLAGKYRVTLMAENAVGKATKEFCIVVGEEISLTPPMGWNSYPSWGTKGYTQERTLRAARALIAHGLDRHGWSYVNIDDGWQGRRGGPYNALQPDPAVFPDMKKMCDELHAMGLKFGIYHTPWVMSYGGRCGGTSEEPTGLWNPTTQWPAKKYVNNKKVLPRAIGKYSFIEPDIRQFAEWGIDYLKYDWQPIELPETREIARALRACRRDILLSLSNNAERRLQENIQDISPLAQAWRTTNDIDDRWDVVRNLGFGLDSWARWNRPGHWNDPDTLVIGVVGWNHEARPTKLTPDEQYLQMTLWSLLAGPFLMGMDLERLDSFTKGLITNDEVIAVNQDPLGRQGLKVANSHDAVIYSKPLADGSYAVGLFNLAKGEQEVTVHWDQLKISGSRKVRDLWRQRDLGTKDGQFGMPIASHGAEMILISNGE